MFYTLIVYTLLLQRSFSLHHMFKLLQCIITVYMHLYVGSMLLMSIATILIKLYKLRVQSRELHEDGVCGTPADFPWIIAGFETI